MLSTGANTEAGTEWKKLSLILRGELALCVPTPVPATYLAKMPEREGWYKKYRCWNKDRYSGSIIISLRKNLISPLLITPPLERADVGITLWYGRIISFW